MLQLRTLFAPAIWQGLSGILSYPSGRPSGRPFFCAGGDRRNATLRAHTGGRLRRVGRFDERLFPLARGMPRRLNAEPAPPIGQIRPNDAGDRASTCASYDVTAVKKAAFCFRPNGPDAAFLFPMYSACALSDAASRWRGGFVVAVLRCARVGALLVRPVAPAGNPYAALGVLHFIPPCRCRRAPCRSSLVAAAAHPRVRGPCGF